jgi:protein-L-isoaspartate(D-aspartate) O-methyltransferase
MNIEAARSQMLGQQIRAWEVLDPRVLGTLGKTRREAFVPEGFRELAFADTEIPLGHGQAMMTPQVEGRLLQALQVTSIDEVFEIGTGSGYLTACLASLGAHVTSIDIFPEFVESAQAKLATQRISNVTLHAADATTFDNNDKFDVVAVTASVPAVSAQLVQFLRPGGRMFIVVGRAPIMEAQLITMQADGTTVVESLFETLRAPMLNWDIPEQFKL